MPLLAPIHDMTITKESHVAISDAARRNHDELFPGRVSTLAQTDPELVEYFDNWAFDEVLQHASDLGTRTRLLVQLASMIASQAVAEYPVMLGAALTVGVTPVEAKEALHQAVPYVGMAKVFDFLHATNEVLVVPGLGGGRRLPGQGEFDAALGEESAPTICFWTASPASTRSTRMRPPTSSTSSGSSQRTASVTTSPVAASTSRRGSC